MPALHVQQADEAVHIGASPAAKSYLDIAAILAAAKSTGADAIHPGYGFLSERPDFAQACADAGLVFVGPPASSIEAMGDKARAKRRMITAGVPCVPGYLGEQQDDATLIAEADKLGYPLLVKAVAGGGGRGMRLSHAAAEMPAALAGARREALSAFGDGTLMLERLIGRGRHIEIQVFADAHGNAVHLGERDCTAQRRRQKVIEEAPSPVVDVAMREAMGRDAVAAALAVGYRGAGTVEFIVDAEMRHYFLEMNTRLQVEHPVTEMITGLDLVEWQLRIAAGEPLPLRQDEIRFDGHAIEARLYAEDPFDGFKPQTGRIIGWQPKQAGIRIDHGIRDGGEVSPYYDPMLAKLIVLGRDREDAIRRLAAALSETALLGPVNNGRFLRELILHPEFREARLHTARLDEWALARPQPTEADWRVAAAVLALGDVVAQPRPVSVAFSELSLQHEDERRRWRISTLGRSAMFSDGPRVELLGPGRVDIDGVQRALRWHREGAVVWLAVDGAVFAFHEPSAYPAAAGRADPLRARSPVAGLVAQVLVQVGDAVDEGQALLSVEAMKMEMWLTAGAAGKVKAVHAVVRDAVAAGAVLIELEL